MNHDRLSFAGAISRLSKRVGMLIVGGILCCVLGNGSVALGQPQPIPQFLLLEPEQVVLPGDAQVDSNARGSFGCRLLNSGALLKVEGSFASLSSGLKVRGSDDADGNPASAVHLHVGRVGISGPIVRNLTVTPDGNRFTFAGSFTVDAHMKPVLLSERIYVQVHTENNPKGELRGQVLAVSLQSPIAVDECHLTAKETAALVQARHATDQPGMKFPSDLFDTYQEIAKYPVLSLTPSRSGNETIDLPFPPTSALVSHPEYYDQRDAGNVVADQQKRYLRRYPSLSVDSDHWVNQTDSDGNKSRTDRQSYGDHPGVQPRPARPLHYRFCLDDPLQMGESVSTEAARSFSAAEEAVARPIRRIRSQVHPRDLYLDDPTVDTAPSPPASNATTESLQLRSVQPADASAAPQDVASETEVFDPKRLFSTLPRFGTGGWDKTTFTIIDSPPGMFPKMDPFQHPPGTNMLPTVYQNMRDRMNNEMINTLPSTPDHPYNLHDGDPVVSRLPTHASPTDDLRFILDDMFETLTGEAVRSLWEGLDRKTLEETFDRSKANHQVAIEKHRQQLLHRAQWAIDILEGNAGSVRHGRNGDSGEIELRSSRIPSSRAYRGFALLHHSGHRRAKRVQPIHDHHGKIVAGNVDVHQIWYDGRIESDTMFYDFGWDDIPLHVKNNNGEIEVRWYSTTDPKLTIAHWTEYRRQKSAIKTQPPKDVFVQEQELTGLTENPPPLPRDVPWTVTFTVDILNRGEDDFSPASFYFDYPQQVKQEPGPFLYSNLSYENDSENPDPTYSREAAWGRMNIDGKNLPMRFGPPHVGMDGTFFPLAEGTRTQLKIKMPATQYQNVHYSWGWRKHAPRAQAVENMHKRVPPRPDEFIKQYQALRLDQSFVDCLQADLAPRIPGPPPRFFRLRIDDHERMVFDGIDFKRNPHHPHRHVSLWVERYLEEEMINEPRRKYVDSSGHVVETESEADHERRAAHGVATTIHPARQSTVCSSTGIQRRR